MKRWIGLHRMPSRQRTLAVAMLLLQAAMLQLLMESRGFPLVIMIAALGSWLIPPQLLIPRRHLEAGYWVIVLGVITKYFVYPKVFIQDNAFVNSELAFEIAAGSQLIGLWTLWSRAYWQQLPRWYLATSAVGVVFNSDIRVTSSVSRTTLGLILAYLVLWAICASSLRQPLSSGPRPPRRYRNVVLTLVVVGAVLAGWTSSIMLYRLESRVEQALSMWFSGTEISPSPGFSGSGGLSDISRWKSNAQEQEALRVRATSRPGYLRGQVFNLFLDNSWQTSSELRTVIFSENPDWPVPIAHNDHFFAPQIPLPESLVRWEVWPVFIDTFGYCFTTQNCVAIACQSDELIAYDTGILQRPPSDSTSRYEMFLSNNLPASPPPPNICLSVPPSLEPHVHELAKRLFLQARTPSEKMHAVERFFRQNFRYNLGLRIPRHEDRLSYFLRERPAAHCEYFASAAAILLRMGGVPTRYVTGFIVNERNPIDGSWVARKQDAHAWVEAYDHIRQRWFVVEATPVEGVPQVRDDSPGNTLVEALKFWVHRLRTWSASGAIGPLLQMLLTPLVAATGLVLVYLFMKRLWTFARHSPVIVAGSMSVTRLMEERQKMDRSLERKGWLRPPGETISQFARRLESANNLREGLSFAQWYRDYAQLRFRDQEIDEPLIERLRTHRKQLTRRLRRRPRVPE